MTVTRNWTLGLIGLELVLAGAMAIGYIAFIQPTAPRYHQAAAKVVLPVPIPVEATPIAPAPVIVAPVAALANPRVTPVKVPVVKVPVVKVPVVKVPVVKVPVRTLPPPALVPAPVPTPVATPVEVKLSPDELIRRGMVSLNAGQWPAAMESFDAARKLQPNNPDLGYLSGMALENLGQPGAAIDAFRSCTSGPYAQIAKGHVKTLVSKLKR